MKVSVNWIKQYIDFELPSIDELVEKIGTKLGGVESVKNIGEKYQGAVIATVVSCVPHPDSDHMHLCHIDDAGAVQDVERGEDGFVQVVCGAPNVREGLRVIWLPPGSTVPESWGKQPFVLGARQLRGVTSNGMLASARELAIGDSHEGIVEVESDKTAGTSFADAYQLNDTIIDIENKMFTHRPDCFGQLGVAREIAGILGKPFQSPDWYANSPIAEVVPKTELLPLTVVNEVPNLVPRFMAVAMTGITMGESPLELQTWLARVGVRPISNIVDVTNYVMLLTGQPMHAYDYDKLTAVSGENGATIVVRNPRSNEDIALLNGKTIKPREEAIMIATDKQLIGVGGAMGGSETEVDSNTKSVVLEVATFDMYSIRRTSMAHGLFTEAVTRFNKGQSPLQNDVILAFSVHAIEDVSGAIVASEVIDDNHVNEQSRQRSWVHPPVPVTVAFINSRLGFHLLGTDMKTLLENVEFQIDIDGENLSVTAPFWRTDVETREDVVEEVGRLYGFDKLPHELPKRSIKPVAKDAMLELKATVRNILAKAGANETLNYSFVHGSLLEKVGQDKAQAFEVSNALSPDLQYYRLSLTPSLLANVHSNSKAGYGEFALFEIGKGHNLQQFSDDNTLPTEFEMLDVVYARADKSTKTGAAFYEARKFLTRLANHFGLQLDYRPLEIEEEYQVAKPYDHTRSAQVWVKDTEIALGMIGEYKASVRKALKLPEHTAGFGISLEQLMRAAQQPTMDWYNPLPRFPKVSQDITLKVTATQPFLPLYQFVVDTSERLRPEKTISYLWVLDIYQREDDVEYKQITFRLEIASFEKTMTDKEVTTLLGLVANAAKDELGAELV